MVLTEVMLTELFKNSKTGFTEISIIPLSHTNTQYTIDTIVLDFRFEDVCEFCL